MEEMTEGEKESLAAVALATGLTTDEVLILIRQWKREGQTSQQMHVTLVQMASKRGVVLMQATCNAHKN